MAISFDTLKSYLDKTVESFGIPGIDISISQEHKELFRYTTGYGDLETKTPLAPDALYNLYSSSKVITSVAVMSLVEKGLINLNDPLSQYISEFANMQVQYGTFAIAPAQKPIRIVDLLNMTSGIGYDPDMPEIRKLIAEKGMDFDTLDFARAIAKCPISFEPGTGWNYGYSMDVLGAVVEVASGEPFGDYLKKAIFDPLGMADTAFTPALTDAQKARRAPQYLFNLVTGQSDRVVPEPLGCEFPASRHQGGGGAIVSTIRDYAAFADALACGGVGATGNRILSERSIRLMSQNRLSGKLEDDFYKLSSVGYGYGLGVSMLSDAVAAGSLAPEGIFNWPGLGGTNNLIDTKNRLSFFWAHSCIYSPISTAYDAVLNIIYSSL